MGLSEHVQRDWISEEEERLAKELFQHVKEKLPVNFSSKSEDDQLGFLLRWLRARDLNLDKAQSMLIKALEWRKENDVDSVLEHEVDPFLIETFQWYYASPDHDGRPVFVYPYSNWDFRKIADNNKAEEFEFFLIHYFETVLKEIEVRSKCRKEGQPPVTQFVTIFDVNQYAFSQMLNFTAMRKWFQFSAVMEGYYPEILYKSIFINCPSYFQSILNLFKGYLAPKTLSKIACYTSLDGWRKDIAKYMDPSGIPEQYGGTSTSPLLLPAQTRHLIPKREQN